MSALKILVLSAAVGTAAPSWSDDAPSDPPIKTHKQRMRECMDRQRAANNAMSTEDMKKACERELKTEDNHPSEPRSP